MSLTPILTMAVANTILQAQPLPYCVHPLGQILLALPVVPGRQLALTIVLPSRIMETKTTALNHVPGFLMEVLTQITRRTRLIMSVKVLIPLMLARVPL